MQNPLLLAVYVLAIFLLVIFNVVSRVFYKRRHGDKYHFYQMFPYEFNYPSVFKENPYGNFLFIFGAFAVSVFYILNPYNSIYRIIISRGRSSTPSISPHADMLPTIYMLP